MTDDSGNSFLSHAGKVKILKLPNEKLDFELDIKLLDDSSKGEVEGGSS